LSLVAKQTNLNQSVGIKVDAIRLIKMQERRGDELYFNVTEYSESGPPRFYQVPSFPGHWLSKFVEGVNNVSLWNKDFNQCENVRLVISFIERDIPPWNVDDLLGTVNLNIQCENNKLVGTWSIPDKSITKVSKNKENKFVFFGDGAEYRVQFKIKNLNIKQE